jgi:TonB family protein
MKKIIFLSLIAALMLAACQNKDKTDKDKTDTTTVLAPPPPVANPSNDTVAPPPPVAHVTDQKLYSFVSLKNPPTYPGGIEKFYQFLGQNIKYPAEALDKKVEGNVHVSFIVEEDGSLTDIKVERKLGAGTDEEAVRVLKLAKKWNPGMKDGKPVRVKYNIPIKFSFNK